MCGEHSSCAGPLSGAGRVPSTSESAPHAESAGSPRRRRIPLVATKIRLMRLGKIRAPYYRIVVADSRTKRDGRVIETIGKYHPKEDPSFIEVDSDRAQYWLGVGAQPTEPVAAILRKTGDWQKFKGEPAPPPLLVAEPKADRKLIFDGAAREAAGLKDTEPKKK